jgi:hypothetical protein
MPVHDWTRVSSGTFHNFHLQWQAALATALNSGGLPDGYFAMVEQRANGPIPDVLAIELPPPTTPNTGAAVYAKNARRITVRDELGEVVTVIEIVSPARKDTPNSIRSFSKKMSEFLLHGVNLVVVDLFPPTDRDPQGIHKAIWDAIEDDSFELPADEKLIAAAYCADNLTGYIEPFAVGDALPDVPLFLRGEGYVPCPLEASYRATWAVMPPPIRRFFDPPAPTGP